MRREEYDAWAEQHATRFGFRDDHDLKMLDSWFEVLGAYDPPDLHEASNRMARADYPSWRPDHLKALLALLASLRAERVEEGLRAAREPDRGTCAACGGSAWVTVPHPRCVRDGEWVPLRLTRGAAVYYTCAVLCSCALGNWCREHRRDAKGNPFRSLEEYRLANPRWREQLRRREEEDRRVRELTAPPPGPREARLDKLLERLAFQWGLPPADE